MFKSIIRIPDFVEIQTNDGWKNAVKRDSDFSTDAIEVSFKEKSGTLDVIASETKEPVLRIRVRWSDDFTFVKRVLGDAPGVEFGDMGWMPVVPEKHYAWYIQCFDGSLTHGYGVKTGCNSFVFWQLDPEGLTATFDIRNGGNGVMLKRSLEVATVVVREGKEGESAYQACRSFCQVMCEKPNLPTRPIFGLNNWYYAYGNITRESVIVDTALTAELCAHTKNRPFMVIDDGWQIRHNENKSEYNGGPFTPSANFRDMKELAAEMSEMGCDPGIWIRPLLTKDNFHESLYHPRHLGTENGYFLDPSKDGVLDYVAELVSGIANDGYKLIKYDFTAPDMLTAHIMDEIYLKENITDGGWQFDDNTVTNAEIIKKLYTTIQKAAGDTLIMGCNTYNHLAAGIHQISRSGLDTSGFDWQKTRKCGINSLAYRLPQNNTFFITDPDCAAITPHVSTELNLRFFEACALSGTSLFISITPGMLTDADKKRLMDSFAIADRGCEMEPVDWFDTNCPRQYMADGKLHTFNWYDVTKGVNVY